MKPAQTSDVDALRKRTRNVLENLLPWLPQASQPTSAPAKMSTAQSAIKAVEARMQKSVENETPTRPRSAPPAVHSPPQLVPAQTDTTRSHASVPTPSLASQLSSSSEADAVIAKLKRELEAAEKRSQQIVTGLRNERSARAKVEEERNRLKSIAISLRRSGEQAGEEKHAREAAEAEVARLRTSLNERDSELEQARVALYSCEKDVERLEVERREAIRDIVRTEDELHGRIVEDGTELISLREQVVALSVGQIELQEEVDQLTEERDSLVTQIQEASTKFQRLKTAMSRMRANYEAQLEAKEAELATARQAAEHARAESSEICESELSSAQSRRDHATNARYYLTPAALPAKLQWLIREADSATKALRRHLDAVMLDLGPVARPAAADETGVLSMSSSLQLVDRAEAVFATRAALVLPHPFNASLSTAEWEHGETPLQQLNKVSRQLLVTDPVSDVCLPILAAADSLHSAPMSPRGGERKACGGERASSEGERRDAQGSGGGSQAHRGVQASVRMKDTPVRRRGEARRLSVSCLLNFVFLNGLCADFPIHYAAQVVPACSVQHTVRKVRSGSWR